MKSFYYQNMDLNGRYRSEWPTITHRRRIRE